jgi:hypothetical protein
VEAVVGDEDGNGVGAEGEAVEDFDFVGTGCEEDELVGGFVGGEDVVGVGNGGKVGEALADVVFGDGLVFGEVDDGEGAAIAVGDVEVVGVGGLGEGDGAAEGGGQFRRAERWDHEKDERTRKEAGGEERWTHHAKLTNRAEAGSHGLHGWTRIGQATGSRKPERRKARKAAKVHR